MLRLTQFSLDPAFNGTVHLVNPLQIAHVWEMRTALRADNARFTRITFAGGFMLDVNECVDDIGTLIERVTDMPIEAVRP